MREGGREERREGGEGGMWRGRRMKGGEEGHTFLRGSVIRHSVDAC